MNDLDIIILAAGKGSRMGGEVPKVLTQVKGKPMLRYMLDAVSAADFLHQPIIVVGYKGDMVKGHVLKGLPDASKARFAHQTEQRGTGHAVASARQMVRPDAKTILILYGDQPLIQPATLKKIYAHHIKNTNSPLTMATINVDSFEGWKSVFADFGKITRDKEGRIVSIIEKKDATEEQQKITELNPAYFCVDTDWLWESLNQITTKNVQGEYYLTNLVGIACKQGHIIASVELPAEEALGVNTPEQLKVVEDLLD